ncbi:Homoserine kinase [Auxenochlorella protothecoides]|uniref:Homoserine kinase n=1 Tax=Auxenochlorella protothecoides TaxID=3075 RepID=A0A087SQS2_AUXPR|nr:Homoserine kinase [Auxenochlorella protothecoides]KFM28076.1 Homoserine kinase [Auxenochlorella protothecoides]
MSARGSNARPQVTRPSIYAFLRSTETLRPVRGEVAASAPATVANLGPGFDWLGCAVEGPGDTVVAVALPTARPGEIVIQRVTGEGGRLSLDPVKNCAGIAAAATLRAMGAPLACGVGLTLHKGLPLGSGLGSSAASAAAAAVAVNELFGAPLSPMDLVLPGLESEAAVSGYHADNIAPALLGGFVLIRSCEPLDLQRLAFPAAIEVPMAELTRNCAAGASLVAGILLGDAGLLGRSLDADVVVEPRAGNLDTNSAQVVRLNQQGARKV